MDDMSAMMPKSQNFILCRSTKPCKPYLVQGDKPDLCKSADSQFLIKSMKVIGSTEGKNIGFTKNKCFLGQWKSVW